MEDDFIPRTVEDIFNDFSGRRSGLLRAFTTDFDRFYSLCDPESENLCVYGHTNGKWEVRLPPKTIPPLLPQPILGINFARDGMRRQDWLLFISVYSDAWLISLYSYFSARLSHGERKRLFGLINDLPTLFEVMESPETQNLT